jgi:hypothetical protein
MDLCKSEKPLLLA